MKSRPLLVGLPMAALLVSTFVVAGPAAPAGMPGPADKIDGEILAHQMHKMRPAGMTAQQHRGRLIESGLNPNNLDAEACALYVHRRLGAAEIDGLANQGIRINNWVWVPPVPGKHPFGFHLATVRYASLDAVRADPRIVRLESVEFADTPANDLGGIMINVDDVHNGTGVAPRDGTGVNVAIADTGMDLAHADLPVPVEAYDMTDGQDPGTWGTDVSNTVSDHGTHVTGSAVGSGGLSGGQFVGGAPGVNLYFYKIGNDTNGNASLTDEIEAINRAVAVGCDIFSMSFGGYRTYMDGSSSTEQAVDAAFAAGTVCFLSAGNEADDDQHDSVNVAPGALSPTFGFTIDNTSNGSVYTSGQWIRVIWIDDNPLDLNLHLACSNLGGGESLFQAFAGTSPRDTEGKRYVLTPSVGAGTSKTYNLTLLNTAGAGSTPLVHCYRVSGKGTFDSPDPFYTVTGPAHADDAIAVGAWTQRKSWINYLNQSWQYNDLTVKTLAPFSSRGPRVDGLIKPDIVAPGAATISSRESMTGLADTRSLIIDNDGLNLDGSGPADYYIKRGTSMAAPLAAGAAALLIEAAPTLTATQVRDALRTTASMAFAPNSEVGWGLIDILAAILAVQPPCPWDCVDGDSIVGIVDFLGLLSQWGQIGTSCDIDGGGVGIVDFLALLANWGPCP